MMSKTVARRGKTPDQRELLRELTLAHGAPGFESGVAILVERHLARFGPISRDRLGGVMVEKTGNARGPRVMLAAHLDEVAMMVKAIHPGGLVKFITLGSWWTHVLPSQRVLIKGDQGDIPGVIAANPPHHLSPAEREKLMAVKDLSIDVGARDAAAARAMGIREGQPVIPRVEFETMTDPDVVCSKAFDDRAGVATMIAALAGLGPHPNRVLACASVQEEVGLRGARTVVDLAEPDVALVLEAPPADDLPGAAEFPQGAMGRGPQLRAYDPTMVTNPRLFEFCRRRAEIAGIPHQVAVRDSGGTDAGQIHLYKRGVPTIVIGVPVRYAHSHLGLMRLSDFAAGVRLIIDLLAHLDAATVRSFTS